MIENSSLRVLPEQFQQALIKLGKFVAIPSVSYPESPDYNMEHLINAAQFVEKELKALDFDVKLIRIKDSAPFVIAKKVVDTALPTIALYAHYDVQPVEREKWKSDPFVMEARDGRLYGRGASDDKGGIIAILTALNVYRQAGRPLPVNVTVFCEGEEEYESVHMPELLQQEAKNLQADALVVLDGMNKSVHAGTLTSSTRGIKDLKLRVDALKKPIHSGIGCLIPCPAMHLATLVASLSNPLAIKGFMEGHQPMQEAERKTLRSSSIDAATYLTEQGAEKGISLRGSSDVSLYERIVEEPSISIVNMNSGKPNGGNSIQDFAECSIGVRILPGQDPEKIAAVVREHLLAQPNPYNLPITIKHDEEGAFAWKADLSDQYSCAYLKALSEHFEEAVAMPCGGALPLLYEFKKVFPNMSMIVPGVEDPDTSAHSIDESQDAGLLRRSINTLISFLNEASTIRK